MKRWPQGRAIGMGFTEQMVDPEQLRAGILVEFEHTDDIHRAKQIALDHLSEFPDYYTRLLKMEKEAHKYWRKRTRG